MTTFTSTRLIIEFPVQEFGVLFFEIRGSRFLVNGRPNPDGVVTEFAARSLFDTLISITGLDVSLEEFTEGSSGALFSFLTESDRMTGSQFSDQMSGFSGNDGLLGEVGNDVTADFDDLSADHLFQVGANAEIRDGASVIVLNDVDAGLLTADDFIF